MTSRATFANGLDLVETEPGTPPGHEGMCGDMRGPERAVATAVSIERDAGHVIAYDGLESGADGLIPG